MPKQNAKPRSGSSVFMERGAIILIVLAFTLLVPAQLPIARPASQSPPAQLLALQKGAAQPAPAPAQPKAAEKAPVQQAAPTAPAPAPAVKPPVPAEEESAKENESRAGAADDEEKGAQKEDAAPAAAEDSPSAEAPAAGSASIGTLSLNANGTEIGPELRAIDFGDKKVTRAAKAFRCYVDNKHKFAMVHIPKNGGSAIGNNMEKIYCAMNGKNWPCDYKLHVGGCPSDGNFFVFAFTRNPWDRAVSMWSYGVKKNQLHKNSVEERLKAAEAYCTFEDFLHKPRGGCGAHTDTSQWNSIYSNDGKPAVNFLGRLEYFDRDFPIVLMKIDPSGKLLELYKKIGFTMHNDSGHKKYTSYFKDQADKDAIAKRWSKDCSSLGYSFDTSASGTTVKDYRDGKPAHELAFGMDTKATQ